MNRYPRWTGPDAPPLDEMPTLDPLEAFDAMRAFLEAYWKRGDKTSLDLRLLLSSIERDTNIRPDGGTLDPASWDDWLDAIATVRKSRT